MQYLKLLFLEFENRGNMNRTCSISLLFIFITITSTAYASNMGKCPYKIKQGDSFQTMRKVQDKCDEYFERERRLTRERDDFILKYKRASPSSRGTHEKMDGKGNIHKYMWYYDDLGERHSMSMDNVY